jgi:hypothetical protein
MAMAAAVTVPEVSRFPQAAGLSLNLGGRNITLGVKLVLEGEILWEDVRPRYSWDSGRTVYGEVETDAHFVYTCEEAGELSYAWTEATRLDYGGRNLFRAPDFDFNIQYAGPDVHSAPPKWRAWEASGVRLKR